MPFISGSGVTIESPDIYSKYHSKYNGSVGGEISQRRSQSILKILSPPSKISSLESSSSSSSSFTSPQNNRHFGFGYIDKTSSLASPPLNPSPIRSAFWRTAAASKDAKRSIGSSGGGNPVPQIYGSNVELPSPDPQSKYFEGEAPIPQSPTYRVNKQSGTPPQSPSSFSPTKYYCEPTTPTTPYRYPCEEETDDSDNCGVSNSLNPLSVFHSDNCKDCNGGLTAIDLIVDDVMEAVDDASQEKQALRPMSHESKLTIKKVLQAAAIIYSDDKEQQQQQQGDFSVYEVPVMSLKQNLFFKSKEDPCVDTYKGACIVPSAEHQISPTAVHDIFSSLSPGGADMPSVGKSVGASEHLNSNLLAKDFSADSSERSFGGVFSFQIPADTYLEHTPLPARPLVPQKPAVKPATMVPVRSGRRFVPAGSAKAADDSAVATIVNDENASPNVFQAKPAPPPAKVSSRTRGKLQDVRNSSERHQLQGDEKMAERERAGSKQSREKDSTRSSRRERKTQLRSSVHTKNLQGRSHSKKKSAQGRRAFDPSKLEAIPEEAEGCFGVPQWLTVFLPPVLGM